MKVGFNRSSQQASSKEPSSTVYKTKNADEESSIVKMKSYLKQKVICTSQTTQRTEFSTCKGATSVTLDDSNDVPQSRVRADKGFKEVPETTVTSFASAVYVDFLCDDVDDNDSGLSAPEDSDCSIASISDNESDGGFENPRTRKADPSMKNKHIQLNKSLSNSSNSTSSSLENSSTESRPAVNCVSFVPNANHTAEPVDFNGTKRKKRLDPEWSISFEELGSYDNILCDVLLDTLYLGFRTHKMGSGSTGSKLGLKHPCADDFEERDYNTWFTRERQLLGKFLLGIVQDLVMARGKVKVAADEIMKVIMGNIDGYKLDEESINAITNSLKPYKEFVLSLSDKQKRDFQSQMEKYLNMYHPNAGYEISRTHRYKSSEKVEACLIATKEWKKGDQMHCCAGTLTALTPEQEDSLQDFSLIYSTKKKFTSLFLGPARFANHDCKPNVQFQILESGTICFHVIDNIKVGTEICVNYGESYFGPNNCDCLCESCERHQRGGFSAKGPKGYQRRTGPINYYDARRYNLDFGAIKKIPEGSCQMCGNEIPDEEKSTCNAHPNPNMTQFVTFQCKKKAAALARKKGASSHTAPSQENHRPKRKQNVEKIADVNNNENNADDAEIPTTDANTKGPSLKRSNSVSSLSAFSDSSVKTACSGSVCSILDSDALSEASSFLGDISPPVYVVKNLNDEALEVAPGDAVVEAIVEVAPVPMNTAEGVITEEPPAAMSSALYIPMTIGKRVQAQLACSRCYRHEILFETNWPTRSSAIILRKLQQAPGPDEECEEEEEEDEEEEEEEEILDLDPNIVGIPITSSDVPVVVWVHPGNDTEMWWPAIIIPPEFCEYEKTLKRLHSKGIEKGQAIVVYMEYPSVGHVSLKNVFKFSPFYEPYSYFHGLDSALDEHMAVINAVNFMKGIKPVSARWRNFFKVMDQIFETYPGVFSEKGFEEHMLSVERAKATAEALVVDDLEPLDDENSTERPLEEWMCILSSQRKGYVMRRKSSNEDTQSRPKVRKQRRSITKKENTSRVDSTDNAGSDVALEPYTYDGPAYFVMVNSGIEGQFWPAVVLPNWMCMMKADLKKLATSATAGQLVVLYMEKPSIGIPVGSELYPFTEEGNPPSDFIEKNPNYEKEAAFINIRKLQRGYIPKVFRSFDAVLQEVVKQVSMDKTDGESSSNKQPSKQSQKNVKPTETLSNSSSAENLNDKPDQTKTLVNKTSDAILEMKKGRPRKQKSSDDENIPPLSSDSSTSSLSSLSAISASSVTSSPIANAMIPSPSKKRNNPNNSHDNVNAPKSKKVKA